MHLRTFCTILSMTLAAVVSPAQQSNTGISRGVRYGELPMTFEENRGQTDPQVKFLSRAKGYIAFLTSGGIVLSLRPTKMVKAGVPSNSSTAQNRRAPNATVEFRLVGSAANTVSVGEYLQSGRVNYFMGSDHSKWRTNVPTYRSVRYKNVYPGIDLIYYGNHQQLEYDFAISPGADPRLIQFGIKGASRIELDEAGNLVLQTAGGELHFQSPVVYQESDGRRVPVRGSYVLKDATHIAFQVASYDESKLLVIDPVLMYSTYLGGSGDDQASGIAVDTAGNVYVAGSTDSTAFPLTTSGSHPAPAVQTHVFVAKLDATGSNLIYADFLGGNNEDNGFALALDAANNVYVTGSTASNNFPMVNPYQGTYPGGFDGFLSKISPDGSSLLYSTYFGGTGTDIPSGLAVDSAGEMVVAGYTSSTDFPVANAYQAVASANQGGQYGNYGFLTKFSPDGSSLVYSTYFGGSSNVALNCGGTPCWPQPDSSIASMALDSSGDAYLTGTTNTYDFPVTQNAYLTTDSTQQNGSVGFVSKFNGSGSLNYSSYFYEASGLLTNPTAIAVDGSGSAYITGLALSDGTFPITSTSICDPSVYGWGCNYAFVTKFDSAGATLLYSTFLGPNNNAVPQAIALDGSHDAYVLASTSSGSFSTVNGIENYGGENDVLLVEIDATASTQLFATYLGGSGNDQPAPGGIVLDANGNLYLTGTTNSTDFPVTPSAFQTVFGGNIDAFIAKIGIAPAVSLSTNSLQFGSETIGSSSQPQTITLSNVGAAILSISTITSAGDFAETNNCGNSVPVAGECTLSVTFAPTTSGSRTGTITVQDDAAGSPQMISLSGTGIANNSGNPVVAFAPPSLTFSSLPVGTTSAPQSLTITNSGTAGLSIASLATTGDFAQTNNCGSTLAASTSCTLSVMFLPTVSGNRTGTLSITDNAAGSPQGVALSGTGADFSLAGSPTSATVKAGTTATFTVTASPVGGSFANQIQLSCSGAPAASTCSLSATSVTPGSKSASVNISIATTASSATELPLLPKQQTPAYAFWIQLPLLGVFAMTLVSSKSRRKTVAMASIAVLLSVLLFIPGCGDTGIVPKGGKGTATGTYTMTITGTSGGLRHSVPLTLTVQ